MAKYVTECIGAFFLALTAGMTTVQQVPFAPVFVGSILMAMVYMGYHVSGGHYNPVVSICLWRAGKLERKYVGPYLLSQIVGTLLAGVAVWTLAGEPFLVRPPADVHWAKVLLAEALFGFALLIVVLHVAADSRGAGNSYYGIAIGFTVMVAGFAVGDVSGGVLNPAVGAGPGLVHLVGAQSFEALRTTWLYWVGPMAGGLLAVAAYRRQGDES